ncbi:MAG: ABC transporter substrate-binding protein [Rhodospirillales bacterium]|nr:ABC transporter substrate-binding protein [Rhodospirillales bacterium]
MKKRLLGAVAAAALALGFAAAAEAKTFVYCSEGSPEGFTPYFYTAGTTFDASSVPIFNRLVEFKLGSTEIEPGLAESWEVSDDGLTYTFKLRKGVKFHSTKDFAPTRDFNADDVIFTFERQWKPDHPFHKVSGGSYEYFQGMGMTEALKSIEKVDDHTVRFVLTEPNAPMLANLGMDFASISSQEYYEAMQKAGSAEKADLQPIGTGPFMLVDYQKDAVIRYKANPDYWKGKAKIDDLVFAITPDASVRYAKLKSGECHLMPYPNPADIAAMKQDPDLNVLQQEGLNVGYLGLNVEHPPLDKKEVRQAINYAINRDAILEAVYQGAGKKAKNPIPPTIWSYNDAVKDYDYNPDKAKELLKQAGVQTPLKLTLWAMPVQRPYNPNAKLMAELMQADLKKVGIEAEIVTFEWGEYLERSKKGEHDMVLLGWTGDNGDPDNFLQVLLGCSGAKDGTNRARWCNQAFEKLTQDAKKTADLAERTKLYKAAQAVFKEEAPWVTIAHSVVTKPMRKEVTGFKISPIGLHIFYEVDLTQ